MGGSLRIASTVVVAAAVVGAAQSARADPDGYRFEYERRAGADQCPDEAEMRARIARVAGEGLFVEGSGDAISCVMSGDGTRLTAEIEVRRGDVGDGNRRALYSSTGDCGELADSAAVVIALALAHTPPVERERVVEEPVVEVDAPEPTHRTSGLRPPPSITAEPSAPFAVASAGAVVHTTADIGFAVGIGGGMHRGSHSLAVELQLESADRTPAEEGGVVATDTGTLLVVGCKHAGAFGGCGVASLGWIHGRGQDVMDSQSSITPHVRAGVRLVGQLDLGDRTACRAFVDLLGSVSRTSLYIDDQRVWSSPRGSVMLGIATALRFP